MSEMDLYLYGEVGEEITLETVEGSLNYIKNNYETKQVNVRMFSPGGRADEAYAIVEAFKRFGSETGIKRVFVNDCLNASAGMVIMLDASDETRGLPYSIVRVHRAWGRVEGDSIKVKEFGDQLESYTDPHIQTLMGRLGQTRESVEALLDEDRWMDLSEAREIGIVDGIHDGVINEELAKQVIQNMEERASLQGNELEVVKQMVDDAVKRKEVLSLLD